MPSPQARGVVDRIGYVQVESWNSLSPNLKRLCVSCNYSCCFFSVTKVASTWQQTETKLRLVVVVRDF
ncbi:hypothetical protein V6N13_106716 [Hibiscus sabdariffa]|uniref:Uncharacterized protein n=1 Tax=Hibiscus sabdariffa TaxID=183260 RepID=A0ABR2F1K4_9ROSI